MNTRRIETPPEVATAADGPAWVEMATRIKNKHNLVLVQAAASYAKIAQVAALNMDDLQADPAAQDEALELIARLGDFAGPLFEVYADLITAWNWLDIDTSEPLPQPYRNPEVFGELDNLQTGWLRQQINRLMQYRATEGNGRSGNR